MYQEIYEKYRKIFGGDPILKVWDNFDVLMEYDLLQGPTHIPLATNGEREDIVEAYSPEQVEKIFSIVNEHITKDKRGILMHTIREAKRAMTTKPYRSDSYEALMNKYIYSQPQLVAALLRSNEYVYNPVVLLNLDNYTEELIPLVRTPSNEFYEANKSFIRKVYHNKSRHLKCYAIHKDDWLGQRPLEVLPDHIVSVNFKAYGPLVWGALNDGDFSSLVIQ